MGGYSCCSWLLPSSNARINEMDARLKKIILLLASVQFIFTLDTTFMNVSISTLVVDLHTTVTGIQAAITLYTLVMAAFMIAGAKIGDIIGRKKEKTKFITGNRL